MKCVLSSVGLNSKICGFGKCKIYFSVGYFRLYSEGFRTNLNLFKGDFRYYFKLEYFVRFKAQEIYKLCLVDASLMTGSATIKGHCGDSCGVQWHLFAVYLHNIIFCIYVCFCYRINITAHRNSPSFSRSMIVTIITYKNLNVNTSSLILTCFNFKQAKKQIKRSASYHYGIIILSAT